MKARLPLLSLFVLTGTSLFFAGCAATPTRESTGEYIDNSAITVRVKAALASDPVTKAREIKVESFRGTVQLSGFVSTVEERERASLVARSVEGVREVQNSLIVK